MHKNDNFHTKIQSNFDNYFTQIVAKKNHFLKILPPDFVTFALTLDFMKNSTNFSKENVEKIIDEIYRRLNEDFVAKRRYAKNPKQMYLMTMIEYSEKVKFHTHSILAVHPETAAELDALVFPDSFCRLNENVSHSFFERTIPDEDSSELKTYTEPTNVHRFVNYMLKFQDSRPKTPDDLLLHAPRQ
jgi:hypothetical protein